MTLKVSKSKYKIRYYFTDSTLIFNLCIGLYWINVKKLKQFKTRCKDDMVNSDN